MTTPTAEYASIVYGPAGVALDDPAERFHEASRLYPDVAPPTLLVMNELARNPALQETVARAGRTYDHAPGIDLPRARVGPVSLRDALARRRSSAPGDARPLRLVQLAAMLGSAYYATGGRRPVPSAGALYPLEVYVIALDVARVDAGAYHYDPYRHRLARIGTADRDVVGRALVDPGLAAHAAALLVVSAVFWRSRFKYGLRGYRFAFLEAGHVVQNVVLAAAALGLPAVPLGGFYDTLLDELVLADGLDEATVYAVSIGGMR